MRLNYYLVKMTWWRYAL